MMVTAALWAVILFMIAVEMDMMDKLWVAVMNG